MVWNQVFSWQQPVDKWDRRYGTRQAHMQCPCICHDGNGGAHPNERCTCNGGPVNEWTVAEQVKVAVQVACQLCSFAEHKMMPRHRGRFCGDCGLGLLSHSLARHPHALALSLQGSGVSCAGFVDATTDQLISLAFED